MDGSDAAFPLTGWNAGMKKRELIAAMALQGLLASEGEGEYQPHVAAERAVKFADALIELL